MTTDPIAAARAMIADAINFACAANHHLAGQAPEQAQQWRDALATLVDALEAERKRAEKAETGRDEWKDEYQTAARLLNLFRDAAFNRQIERDQALARLLATLQAYRSQ